MATVFVAICHLKGDVVGIHAARPGTRFEALEPVYQGVREHFGPLAKEIADGLTLRHDHGPKSHEPSLSGGDRLSGDRIEPEFCAGA